MIDTATNTVTATIGVSAQPRFVTVSPDGLHAFVANADPDTVGVIDTATNTLVENIGFGDCPTGIAITPDGTRAYVTNAVSGTVGVMATTVIPDQGSMGGGTTVTLTGHHLSNATAVNFGTARAVITADTATSLTATAPAGSSVVPVTVTTPGGTGMLGHFYYRPIPAITGISPAAGPVAGSDQDITITGRNLTGAIEVRAGGELVFDPEVPATELNLANALVGAAEASVLGAEIESMADTHLETPGLAERLAQLKRTGAGGRVHLAREAGPGAPVRRAGTAAPPQHRPRSH